MDLLSLGHTWSCLGPCLNLTMKARGRQGGTDGDTLKALKSKKLIIRNSLMETALKVSSSPCRPIPSSRWSNIPRSGLNVCAGSSKKLAFFHHDSHRVSISNQIKSRSVGDLHRCRSNLESLFCYDKSIPEEIIEKPVGLSLDERNIGDNHRCEECHAKGAVLCATCSGSGLYIDSILESQGILVKVRCLGCGGTGNIMCLVCGGHGHLGVK